MFLFFCVFQTGRATEWLCRILLLAMSGDRLLGPRITSIRSRWILFRSVACPAVSYGKLIKEFFALPFPMVSSSKSFLTTMGDWLSKMLQSLATANVGEYGTARFADEGGAVSF